MTKIEIRFIVAILVMVGLLSVYNFQSAYLRTRDVQRKNDLKYVAVALDNYFYDFGQYPESLDGMIVACGSGEALVPCVWGKDAFRDVSDLSYPPYIENFPRDPQEEKTGAKYVYLSDTRNFQLLSSLENRRDDEYNEEVASQKIACGDRICSYKVVSGKPAHEERN